MLLSVVSALARLDLDPWQEAASLTGLPVPSDARVAAGHPLLYDWRHGREHDSP
jgi:hypothetical protein